RISASAACTAIASSWRRARRSTRCTSIRKGFRTSCPVQPSPLSAFLLLALANLFWSGNWIAGRALRDAFDPVTLNFWRWVVATLVLAPFALPALAGKWGEVRRHAGILLLLSFTGVALFQTLVYLGLRTTAAVNAVLLN